MILDSSAVIAILQNEPERKAFNAMIDDADVVRISTATLVETSIVVDAIGIPRFSRRLDELIRSGGIEIEPFTVEQASIARSAYADYGKGSGHPAQLNFGDCFSYALAYAMDEPLLFKGADFGHTDIASAH